MAMFEFASLVSAVYYPLWDLSGVLALTSESSFGQFLIAFLGWDPKPDLLEFGLWIGYVVVVGYLFLRPQRPGSEPISRTAEAAN
jgi:high-affinity iron transporter